MSEQTAVLPSQQTLERCTGCGKPMAGDQRYCLNCGKRRGKPRVEFEEYLPEAGGGDSGPPAPPAQGQVRPVPPEEPDYRPEREVTPLMAAVGLAGVAAILLIGVLIGRSGGGNEGTSQQPIIASTGLPTSTTTNSTSTTTASVTVTPDWPQGTEGFTIELATLSKEGADGAAVESAKTDLMSQGATEVGVIDSDQYGSLPEGNYVLYSGVYTTKAEAETALTGLKTSFPDAQVIEVAADAGGGAKKVASEGNTDDGALTDGSAANSTEVVEASEEDLQALEEATPEEYEELQKKLPPTISTPGEAPKKDNKAPGGGGDAVSIG
jgi:hypothetical protein